MAVRVGAGVEAWELFNFMATYNITIVAPGGSTVGVGGGWFAVGGHGALTSLYGLGADQVLSIQVVTADGRFLTADPFTNEDLFYALRGGGGSKNKKLIELILMYCTVLTDLRHIWNRHFRGNESLPTDKHDNLNPQLLPLQPASTQLLHTNTCHLHPRPRDLLGSIQPLHQIQRESRRRWRDLLQLHPTPGQQQHIHIHVHHILSIRRADAFASSAVHAASIRRLQTHRSQSQQSQISHFITLRVRPSSLWSHTHQHTVSIPFVPSRELARRCAF